MTPSACPPLISSRSARVSLALAGGAGVCIARAVKSQIGVKKALARTAARERVLPDSDPFRDRAVRGVGDSAGGDGGDLTSRGECLSGSFAREQGAPERAHER